MQLRTDDEIVRECEERGEAAVEALLSTNYFIDNPAPAYEWLIKRKQEIALYNKKQQIRHNKQMLYATWAGPLVAFILVWLTYWGISSQNKFARDNLNLQASIVHLQASIELDKEFNSPEMRLARRELAKQLLGHKGVTVFRLADFFETLDEYMNDGFIDKNTVYDFFSYWVERYWNEMRPSILAFRKQEHDSTYYQGFEDLDKLMLSMDKRAKSVNVLNKNELRSFLNDEVTLSQ